MSALAVATMVVSTALNAAWAWYALRRLSVRLLVAFIAWCAATGFGGLAYAYAVYPAALTVDTPVEHVANALTFGAGAMLCAAILGAVPYAVTWENRERATRVRVAVLARSATPNSSSYAAADRIIAHLNGARP